MQASFFNSIFANFELALSNLQYELRLWHKTDVITAHAGQLHCSFL